MKVFVQSKGESVIIAGEISVTVVDVFDEEVVLAIDAPAWMEVCETQSLEQAESLPVRPR